jgi:hypothetical protein
MKDERTQYRPGERCRHRLQRPRLLSHQGNLGAGVMVELCLTVLDQLAALHRERSVSLRALSKRTAADRSC